MFLIGGLPKKRNTENLKLRLLILNTIIKI